MGMFTRLARVGLLLDAFQHRCLDRFDLNFIDYSVLRVLQLSGPPYELTAGELGDAVLRSSGGMTLIVDRLERADLVARVSDRADRRRVVVRLTPAGRELAQRASAAYARERRRIIKALSAEEVEQTDAAIRLLLDVFTTDAHA
jgi:DNA-binding MarR family transcriptional regulator